LGSARVFINSKQFAEMDALKVAN